MFMICFISLQYAKSVIGVELVEDAVKDAEKNAKLNGKKMQYSVVYWIKCYYCLTSGKFINTSSYWNVWIWVFLAIVY